MEKIWPPIFSQVWGRWGVGETWGLAGSPPRALSGLPPPLGPGATMSVRLFWGRGGAFQGRRARTLLLLRGAEVGHRSRAGGRGRRMLVLRGWGVRQRLVGTLSHHVHDALAVVAFLWLGGQATLLGMVIQTSTVITAAGDNGDKSGMDWGHRCVVPAPAAAELT